MTERTITIPESEYARLLGQGAFLRAAIHALGGKYEVSFENISKNGHGGFELRGDPERQTLICQLIERDEDDE